jgi:arsenite methyltransferase
MKQKTNYGFDAPSIMVGLIAGGVSLLILGIFSPTFLEMDWLKYVCYLLLLAGTIASILGVSMYFYGISGKFLMRDFMLKKINWQGDEMVLDVGTGRGLFLVGAAKHLTTGKSIGIDIWNEEDLSGNNAENAYHNATLEGVREKVEIWNDDAQKMSFADNTFDVVFSMFCIHNIEEKEGQEKACFEIARVLKPNGRALIGDYIPTHDYAKYFEKAGLEVVSSRNYIGVARAMMWMTEARKK